ncbi:hypothetical protein NOF04DRAFT_1197601, partial [Fusarium oxysporum II5]
KLWLLDESRPEATPGEVHSRPWLAAFAPAGRIMMNMTAHATNKNDMESESDGGQQEQGQEEASASGQRLTQSLNERRSTTDRENG